MPESIPELERQLHEKERERSSVSTRLSGAGLGAVLTRGSAAGAAVGALLSHEKDTKAQLDREIEGIKRRIQDTHARISQMQTQKTQLQNSFQDQKIRYEAEVNQRRADLERQKNDTQDPSIHKSIDEQLMRLHDEAREHERQDQLRHTKELDALQQEINTLSL